MGIRRGGIRISRSEMRIRSRGVRICRGGMRIRNGEIGFGGGRPGKGGGEGGVLIYFGDEIVVEHFGDDQQALDVDAFALEDVVEGSARTVDTAGKFGIGDALFIYFLFDQPADIDLLSRVHGTRMRFAERPTLFPGFRIPPSLPTNKGASPFSLQIK